MLEYLTAIFKGCLLPMQSRLVPIAKFFNESGIYGKNSQKYRRSSRDMPRLVCRGFINSTYIYRTKDVYLTRQ
jgi:hypothetical protein